MEQWNKKSAIYAWDKCYLTWHLYRITFSEKYTSDSIWKWNKLAAMTCHILHILNYIKFAARYKFFISLDTLGILLRLIDCLDTLGIR